MKVGVVVLSRYSSTRLPGKALMKIKDKPVLQYIIERLEQVLPKELIVIATSEEDSDDPINEFAEDIGINCFRGSLKDVSTRFYSAAQRAGWDFAVRINGDNVFVDINLLKKMIDMANKDAYDFISNVKGRTFPKGMSIEIVRLTYYASVLQQIQSKEGYSEHVTLYLYENETNKHFYIMNESIPAAKGIQLALDNQDDFDRTTKIIDHFVKPHWTYNLKEIINILNEG